MSQSLPSFPELVRETIQNPRGAAGRIIAQNYPASLMWEALLLVVALSVLAGYAPMALLGPADEEITVILPAVFTSPLWLAAVQGVLLALAVLAIHRIGRSFGGQGRFADAIALMAWLQLLMVLLQIVQAVLILLAPTFSTLVGVAGVIAFFYLLTQFVCELHGFSRPGVVFFGILVSMIGLIMLMSILLGLLGVGQMEIPDV
ncbi:Yip1 family protein [Tropicimonas marinistellae]|uniref:Yip1 family protein n=1 Tax=Tropicimonas marinistellae TaxID=1739787 RepID=UPI001372A445|nr:Yip1 family protein [Tropicimonas marinistellae]